VGTSSEFEGSGLGSRSVKSSGLEIDVRVKAREFVGDPSLVVEGRIVDREPVRGRFNERYIGVANKMSKT
jgi:hypothetical protein